MAPERHDTVIDGHRYEMTTLAATPGRNLFLRLFKMLGPSVGAIIDATANTPSIDDLDLSSKVVVDAIQTLTSNVNAVDFEYVVNELRKQCHVGVDGTSKTIPLAGVFEAHFSGDLRHQLKWLAWGLKVQFGTFYSAFVNFAPPVPEGAQQVEKGASH